MKILIYLIAIAVVVGGAVMFLGGGSVSESPADVSKDAVPDAGDVLVDEGTPPAEAGEPFPATKLYNAEGFIDCSYFWNDVRAACPEVKQTQWASNEPWDINAGPFVCAMKALGSEEGEFQVGVSRAEDKSAASAVKVFNDGRAGFAELGFTATDVSGLGDKAYTVSNPAFEESGFNFTANKGSWIVDITSSIPAFCSTEAQTKDALQRILRKLP